MTAIRTSALTKRFGEDVVAVDSLQLTVEEGEVYGFLGPNGAGKSTTINMLLDFVRPSDGTATVLGMDAQAEAAKIRKHIGVLPEGAALYERLTGVEHLEWVARMKDVEADPYAILDRVGLDVEDGERAAGGYSKGMQQRLGFGMALISDPDLLILDEPSSGLDPTGMQEMREIIREEAQDGTTVFFSSHILAEVEAVCDRIGIMHDGRLGTTGTIEDLRDGVHFDTQITLEVAQQPATSVLEGISGVTAVEAEESAVTATCADPTVKVDVVQAVAEETEVTDILSEAASLEQLFNTYTGAGEDEHVSADATGDAAVGVSN